MPTTLEDRRASGEAAELEFCAIAESHGLVHHRLQEGRSASAVATRGGRSRPLPDVLLHGRGATSCVEVKRKSATSYGTIGLEAHRAESMRRLAESSGLPVLYAVQLEDGWWATDVHTYLVNVQKTLDGPSLVSGQMRTVEIHFTPLAAFRPLGDVLDRAHPRTHP